MYSIFLKTLGQIVHFLLKLGFKNLIVSIFARKIEFEENNNGRKYNILALNPSRFRGDLEVFESSKEFKVFKIPFRLQALIFAFFFGKDIDCTNEVFFDTEQNSKFAKERKRYRDFLKIFLPGLYKCHNIHFVIGAAIHYRHDFDWGYVSNELLTPYIVLHRENLLASESMISHFKGYIKYLNRFPGTKIIVQNNIVKELIIKSKYAGDDQVTACGNLRMDNFLRKIREDDPSKVNNRVTFFSFLPGFFVFNDPKESIEHWPEDKSRGWYKLFENIHVLIASIARNNPDIDFVIKTKWEKNWINVIKELLYKNGLDVNKIKNLTITANVNPQDLILRSDVVCGFGSTALLEAAVAKKHVIIPMFDEPSLKKNRKYLLFPNQLDLFTIIKDKNKIEQEILRCVANPKVKSSLISKRIDLFEEMVSNTNGDSFERYKHAILESLERTVN